MGLFDKFQALVGRDQGASRFFIRVGGFFNVGDVPGGANGTDVTGLQFKNIMLSPVTRTRYDINSAALAVSVMAPGYGLCLFSAAAGVSTCSIKLPSATPGATLLINVGGVQSDLLFLAGNGPSLISIRGSDLSSFKAVNGSANAGYALLNCYTQGEWQVAQITSRAAIVEQASA